ncbi:MAG: DUF5677 domain-containing protein [Bacilli bacterium]|nr:DUF5677 domain-containing protein [Bacilli bacterium]
MNSKLSKEEFLRQSQFFPNSKDINLDFMYDVYDLAFDGIIDLLEAQNLSNTYVDSLEVLSYILGEYVYSTSLLKPEDKEKFCADENIVQSMASVAADKYLSLSIYNHQENRFTNYYLPPISSINLYVNLMLNIVTRYPKNDPMNTLIIDLLIKSLSIARSIIKLLCDGYETEAFAVWRTLHECECTLILLDKYGDVAINSYLKHMRYGIAYKGAFDNKEEESKVIEKVKEEMAAIGLKSKDMKKYIEYGWLLNIPGHDTIENFKLNFRDGLESLAGLHKYAELYMTSSEILHSTPLLIYSNKQHFFFLTLLNLYESFFRIEKVFVTLFFSRVGDADRIRYMEMRKLYYSQLVNIHQRETMNFKLSNSKKG